MTWRHLSLAEGRQALRLLERLGRQNPLLLALVLVAAGGVLWLSLMAGSAVTTIVGPRAGAWVPALVAAGGLVAGVLAVVSAPGLDQLDDQIAAVPLSRAQLVFGQTGVPLLTAWLMLSLPTVLFGFSLYSSLRASAPVTSAAVLAAIQLLASVVGGGIGTLARRLRRDASGQVHSRRMGRGLPGTALRWMVISGWRDGKVRDQALLTVGFGFACLVLLVAGPQASLLVPFAALILMVATASVLLVFSGDFVDGGWLWKLLPVPAASVGRAWWVAATATTLVLTLLAVFPLSAAFPSQLPFLALAVVIATPVPGAVGRLLPWRSSSAVLQLGTGVALSVFYGAALALTLGLTATLDRAVGLWGALLGLAGSIGLVYLISVLSCEGDVP